MSKEKPLYLGSWKGRVILAIALDGARTWNEIREFTGLSPKSLNRTLAEMMNAKALEKIVRNEQSTYKVSYNLSHDYLEYFAKQDKKKKSKKVTVKQDDQKAIVQWIDDWIRLNNINISLGPGHFFLEGMHLDEFSKKIIHQKAQQEVIIVNPFVEKVDISKTLIEAAKRGVATTLITRPPTKNTFHREEVEKFLQVLEKSNVNLVFDPTVHAKIIVADRAVAIVSSMNFNSSSSAGKNSEAGIVTIKDSVVESILEMIIKIQDMIG